MGTLHRACPHFRHIKERKNRMTPNHVAIILDGNGRWAKAKGMPRNYGHVRGAKNVEIIARAAWNIGIRYLTLYAFSTENWNRPKSEVNALMELLDSYLRNCLKVAEKNHIRVRVIGDISCLNEKFRQNIRQLERASKAYDGLSLQIAINYGSRDEMLRAAKKLMQKHDAGELPLEDLDEASFASCLDTAGLPDPDLLIRTGGEQRLSNYLLWQLAYAEFYFTKTPWPDFDEEELKQAVAAYSARDRRFGGIQEGDGIHV